MNKRVVFIAIIIAVIVISVVDVIFPSVEGPDPDKLPNKTTATTTTAKSADTSDDILEFTLTAGEQGEYGELVTYSPGTDMEETMYIYHVPAGVYTTTNIGQYMTQISVYNNDMILDDNGYHQYSGIGDIKHIDVSESVMITVEENQHIEIHEPTKLQMKQISSHGSETTQSTSESSSKIKYGEGMYKVGIDIPAGEYLLVIESDKPSAYYCVSSDSNQNNILENGVFYTITFLTVEDGQFLQLKDALMTSVHNLDTINFSSAISETIYEGMYRVGIDIPSGEYKLIQYDSASYSAYYCIYDSSKVSKQIIANNSFGGNSYVTVYDGQYLLLQRCKTNIIDNRTPLQFEHIYSSGEYVVGENIPSGEYYVELKSDYGTVYTYNPNDLTDSLMTSVETHYYVTFSDGYMVKLSGVTATPVSEVSKKYDSSNLSPGLYRVGSDIEAGTYKCTPVSFDEIGKWESFYFVYDSSHTNRNIIEENFIGANDTVTVKEGQYLDLASCTASLIS